MPRGRKPGCTKSGGRVKGSINKISRDIVGLLDSLGCNPIEGLAMIALDEAHPIEIRQRCYSDLAQYVHPKRRAVEVTGPDGAAVDITVSASEHLTSRVLSLIRSGESAGSDGATS